jgi:hypothetical protein
MELLIILLLLVMLSIVAAYKGADSRDGVDAPEWEKRLSRGMSL